MNLRIITKNHAAGPKMGFLTKSISKPNGSATAMPRAWELKSTSVKDYNEYCDSFSYTIYVLKISSLNLQGQVRRLSRMVTINL